MERHHIHDVAHDQFGNDTDGVDALSNIDRDSNTLDFAIMMIGGGCIMAFIMILILDGW